MANCPQCQSEIDDGVCPKCGDDLQPKAAREGKPRFQFGLRFLFFLMCLTAFACAISKIVEIWKPAPLIIVAGLLFWRTRRAKYAFFPGFGFGVVIGVMLLAWRCDFGVYIGAFLGAILASLNAIVQGDYPSSGFVALVASVVYGVTAGPPFSP